MNAPSLFKNRPQTVEAWQWNGQEDTAADIIAWVTKNRGRAEFKRDGKMFAGPGRGMTFVGRRITLYTPGGERQLLQDHWLVLADGKFSVWKPESFARLYDAIGPISETAS